MKILSKRLIAISKEQYVYTLVPKKAIPKVLSEGLFSSEALLKRPDLMALSTKKNETVEDWQKKIKKNLKDDFNRPSLLGPSVFFHYPPKHVKLEPNNPINLYDLELLKIDLTDLMKDYPKTKIFGMELTPFDEKNPDAERHRYLTEEELDHFIKMSPEENWKDYADLDHKGLYAPNVPHASLHVPGGIVPPKYIEKSL